jgi:hypothetical protein
MTDTLAKPRRRFLRFSLRSLLIAVTVAGIGAGWVAWQRQIVRDRQAMRSWLQSQGGWLVPDLAYAGLSIRGSWHQTRDPREKLAAIGRRQKVHGTLPIVRQWFGDEYVEGIFLPDALSGRRREIERMFSESTIVFESDVANDELLEREQWTRRALAETTRLEFDGAELEDVVSYIMDLHNADIHLDTAALAAAQIDPAVPVTFQARDMVLEQALKELLAPLKLTFVFRQHVLTITTEACAQATQYAEVEKNSSE